MKTRNVEEKFFSYIEPFHLHPSHDQQVQMAAVSLF